MFETSPKQEILNKMQMKITNRRKIKTSLKWLFRNIQFFISKKLKKLIFYITFYKIQNFQKSVKKCYRTMPGHLVRQRSGWYIDFRQTYGTRTVSIDDVIFQTAILSIFRHSTAIKMTFLESWDQIGSLTHIVYMK